MRGFEEGKRRRERTRGGGVRSGPRLAPACPGAQKPVWGLAGTVRPGRAGGSGGASAGAAPRGLGGCCWAPRALGSWQFSIISSRRPQGRMYCRRTCKSMGKGPGRRPGGRANWERNLHIGAQRVGRSWSSFSLSPPGFRSCRPLAC